MNKMFKDLTISKKLSRVFIIIIACLLLSIIVSIAGIFTVKNQLTYFYNTPYKNAVAATMYRRNVQSAMKNIISAITSSDQAETEKYLAEADKDVADQAVQREFLKANSSAKEIIARMDAAAEKLAPARQHVVDLARKNQTEEAFTSYKEEYLILAQPLLDVLKELGTYAEDNAVKSYTSANTLGIVVTVLLSIVGVISLLLTIYFSRFLTKLLTGPIMELEEAAKEMSEGSLDVAITYESKDELGSLAKSLKGLTGVFQSIIPDIQHCLGEMADGNFTVKSNAESSYIGDYAPIIESMRKIKESLNDTLGQIQEASKQVQAGAQNLSEGAQGLAEGATNQASSVEELTATINEVSSQVSEDAKNAMGASQDADEVGRNAQTSQEQMKKVVSAMENISNTSSQIELIINSIEEIASQTNLLSLNASIEAARAGEAGKGFAVVANEIGKLASESAQAATNTRNLIQVSINEIEKGNNIVQDTSDSLNSVLSSITRIVGEVDEIRESTQRQAESMNQISQAIEQIAQTTEDNSAIAEESSATSEELFAQSESLNDLIGRFKIDANRY